jgi:hypothetical protein
LDPDRTHVFDFIFPPSTPMPCFISHNHVLANFRVADHPARTLDRVDLEWPAS